MSASVITVQCRNAGCNMKAVCGQNCFFLEEPNFQGLLLMKVNDCQQSLIIFDNLQLLSKIFNDCQLSYVFFCNDC